MVRLITINTINAYATSILLTVAGGFEDARLLLPGWIGIATVRAPIANRSLDLHISVHPFLLRGCIPFANPPSFVEQTLTVCYHLVHQKINIRKETSTSVNVFSIASYFSMVTLLAHLHNHQPSYPKMPVLSWLEMAWHHTYRIWNQTKDSFEQREL